MLILVIVSGMASAGTPPPVPTPRPSPTPVPPPSGGYTPPPSYSPPAFQPYTEDMKSTDGSVIGKLAGIDIYTVRLTASRSASVDGKALSIDVGADLNKKPESAMMDIVVDKTGNLPGGMDNVEVLSAATITTKSSNCWSVKSGTPFVKFTLPASSLAGAVKDTKYYLVRYDGAGYQILAANVATDNSMATIEVPVSDISGTFTAVMTCPPKTITAPAATLSTPTPAPVPCPTPAHQPTGIVGVISSLGISAFGTFAIGEVAGAMILLIMGRFTR